MHAIIERTASFVCRQGAQFEIMLKAKQARNSQFDFLRFDHYLNPYYKFIQKAMKRDATPSWRKTKVTRKKVGPTASVPSRLWACVVGMAGRGWFWEKFEDVHSYRCMLESQT